MRVANPWIKCWGCACIWKIAGCFCPERLSSENTTWLGKDSEGTGGDRRQKEGEWQQKNTTWLSADCSTTAHTVQQEHLYTWKHAAHSTQCRHVSIRSQSMFHNLYGADWRVSFYFSQSSNASSCRYRLPGLFHPSSSTTICLNPDQREVLTWHPDQCGPM